LRVQSKSNRKPTGGRYTSSDTKRIHQKGRLPSNTRIGEQQDARSTRTIGGNSRTRMVYADRLNLFDPKTKKHVKAKIKTVVKSDANRHFVRRNILTKGTVVETDKGKAKITSRPGQEGMINAVLMK
jgi:small subunit ribosomal protein S8e